MLYRSFNPDIDLKAVHRIWRECGWLEKDKESIFDEFIRDQYGLVADLNGSAECFALRDRGTMRYLNEDIQTSFITAVNTSHIARKQGLAANLVARMLLHEAGEGMDLAALGMFDQGFYNKVGFGTGSYEHWLVFDPAQLHLPDRPRIPHRLGADTADQAHANRLNRMRRHGSVNLHSASITRAEIKWFSNQFGLGYFDGSNGSLSHHIWLDAKDVEPGPYTVPWMAYETWDQFLELLGLLRNLGDQIHAVRMREPAGMQMQDLLKKPFRNRTLTAKSKFEQINRAAAYWQARILNLERCLAATHLTGESLEFNLILKDPVENYLMDDPAWRGVGGKYTVTLGPESSAARGETTGLPTLRATVNSFTRLWLGVAPASTLMITDSLKGPVSLIEALDTKLRLPRPAPDWDF